MKKKCSFKFLDDDLNQQLMILLRNSTIKYEVSKDGVVRYSSEDIEIVENDLICSIRDEVFTSWQVLTCPPDWTDRYRIYMDQHQIPFHEELSNGELWFLLPRRFRPQRWELDRYSEAKQMAM